MNRIFFRYKQDNFVRLIVITHKATSTKSYVSWAKTRVDRSVK